MDDQRDYAEEAYNQRTLESGDGQIGPEEAAEIASINRLEVYGERWYRAGEDFGLVQAALLLRRLSADTDDVHRFEALVDGALAIEQLRADKLKEDRR